MGFHIFSLSFAPEKPEVSVVLLAILRLLFTCPIRRSSALERFSVFFLTLWERGNTFFGETQGTQRTANLVGILSVNLLYPCRFLGGWVVGQGMFGPCPSFLNNQQLFTQNVLRQRTQNRSCECCRQRVLSSSKGRPWALYRWPILETLRRKKQSNNQRKLKHPSKVDRVIFPDVSSPKKAEIINPSKQMARNATAVT